MKTNTAVVHREIGIDCGHRVPDHASKCRSPHGHRYRIITTCAGEVLNQPGANEHGMVIDFGTIKRLMMDILDAVFDHAFVVSKYDTALMEMYFPGEEPDAVYSRFSKDFRGQLLDYCAALRGGSETKAIKLPRTCYSAQDPDGMKIVPVDYSPTAENMARNMFDLMRKALHNYYRHDEIRIMNIRLYETPNGYVDYPGKVFARDMPDWVA